MNFRKRLCIGHKVSLHDPYKLQDLFVSWFVSSCLCVCQLLYVFLSLCFFQSSKVMELILNKTSVACSVSCEDSTSGHGDLFYATFKSVIIDNLLTIVSESVPLLVSFSTKEKGLVGTVLSDMLDAVARNATIRHKFSFNFSHLIVFCLIHFLLKLFK